MQNQISNTLTVTENNDKAFTTTGSACLDFFVRITRSAEIKDYIETFLKAWIDDKETAVKLLMNLRDVRKGKGEKLIPIVIMVFLKNTIEKSVYNDILTEMIGYGYWKDLLKILEIEIRFSKELNQIPSINFEIEMFANALQKDMQILETPGNTKAAISLCGKWAPSEKSHYDHHPMNIALKIMKKMNLDFKAYRLTLTKLRSHLNLLETLMAGQRYNEIDFSKLPSVAHMKMKKAFLRDTNSKGVELENRKVLHQTYVEYLKKLSEGKVKVNVKGIQPHELVEFYISQHSTVPDSLTEGLWSTIKKNVKETGVFRDVTAVVDVSASMDGQPMSAAIALGILVAECTTGPFYGKVITFSETPQWHQLTGSNLAEQVHCLKSAHWGGSTNMESVFNLILQNAVSANLTQNEMVKTLFIFTDMQFNECTRGQEESVFENAIKNFNNHGYQLPKIVCWNLRTSNSKSLPVQKTENNFVMLSGFSSELLKCILTGTEFTPILMMNHVLEPYVVPPSVVQSNNPLPFTVNLSGNLTENFHMESLEKAVKKSEITKSFKGDFNSIIVENGISNPKSFKKFMIKFNSGAAESTSTIIPIIATIAPETKTESSDDSESSDESDSENSSETTSESEN